MLTDKLVYGFHLNLYLELDISVVDFDIYPDSTINMPKSGLSGKIYGTTCI